MDIKVKLRSFGVGKGNNYICESCGKKLEGRKLGMIGSGDTGYCINIYDMDKPRKERPVEFRVGNKYWCPDCKDDVEPWELPEVKRVIERYRSERVAEEL